jgi:hypothetical protein
MVLVHSPIADRYDVSEYILSLTLFIFHHATISYARIFFN